MKQVNIAELEQDVHALEGLLKDPGWPIFLKYALEKINRHDAPVSKQEAHRKLTEQGCERYALTMAQTITYCQAIRDVTAIPQQVLKKLRLHLAARQQKKEKKKDGKK